MILLPLVLLFSVWCAHAKKGEPRIKATKFETAPVLLQYFEDSNSALVFEVDRAVLWWSNDAGESWEKANGIEPGKVTYFWLHPYDNKRAYATGRHGINWLTTDQGKSWDKFDLGDKIEPAEGRIPFSFHAGDPKKVVINAVKCKNFLDCEERAYYTTDDFKHHKLLRKKTRGCGFVHATPEFHAKGDKDDDRVMCIVEGKTMPAWPKDNRLLISDDFFEHEHEPAVDDGRTVQGFITMAVVKGYLVAAAKSEGTRELALYVTADAQTWHRAEFPDMKLEEEAYTVLESTGYSLQLDVMYTPPFSMNPMGILFSSNSNGTYFTKNVDHTNRSPQGIVDFEKIQNIQGIVLVNTVDNWVEVEKKKIATKKLVSRISFDDGRTFEPLKIVDSGEELHLHSVTEMSNTGRVFSSAAPGLVMGIGNTGKFLKPYTEGDLYVSDDAGLTWRKALPEAHKYEFGDQGSVLVAVYDEGVTDKISYSLNHGVDWEEFKLEDKVDAKVLTTVPDSTTRKFILEATKRDDRGNVEYWIYAIDFDALHERKCEEKDFEIWYARKTEDGEPACLMGHKQKFKRRKRDSSDCFVEDDFREALPEPEVCKCTDADFECDFNFVRDKDSCIPAVPLKPKGDDVCDSKDKKFKGPSGFRKIPGNDCDPKGGVDKEGEIDRECSDTITGPPASGEISVTIQTFKADEFGQKVYRERAKTSHGEDETIIMSTMKGNSVSGVYRTTTHGKDWKAIKEDVDNIKYIVPHTYDQDTLFILTGTDKVYTSVNRGKTFDEITVPYPLDPEVAPIGFHQDHQDWLIWTGSDCEGDGQCRLVASYSTDRGSDWKTLIRACQKCEFIKKETKAESDKLVYCVQHKDEDTDKPLELRSSDEWFADRNKKPPHFEDIITFATMSEFIIVAQKDPESNLKVEASVDGETFADAKFPPNFNVHHQTAYTVLDSSTHSVFLHVTKSNRANFEYGHVMKSNSNGTSYVMSIPAVNRNRDGFVDFEKMQGIEGVAMVNVVDNLEEESTGKSKKLKSLITHNDGGLWAPLKAPPTDGDGKPWGCDVAKSEECSLHIHSYTERADPRDTFSSPSATGLMMGCGNVGSHLSWKKGDDVWTFVTIDGGINWRAVKKGNYMWEYGDQGSLIVIVEEDAETNKGFYTLDEGATWTEFQFAEHKVKVSDLTTVPSDNSKNFVIWASNGKEIMTINVDFSGLRSRKCVLDEDSGSDDEGDFELWSPSHPLEPDGFCLFGHRTKYHRKKVEKECWIGPMVEALHDSEELENCTCKRHDFECDYNYELQKDRTCDLVQGLEPNDPSNVCEDKSVKVYFETKGYRKVPISTCSGGDEYKYVGEEHSCPGWEKEFAESHRGLSGFWFFVVAVLLPICAAAGAGYWVHTRWDGKFGSIRLGEGSSGLGLAGRGSVFDTDKAWVQYPVMALSAVVAVVAAVPLLLGAAWRYMRGSGAGGSKRYTTRQSFARGRQGYAVVDPDEDELLGDDDDDDPQVAGTA